LKGKNKMAKKSPFEIAEDNFSLLHFFATRFFFAILSSNSDKD